MANRRRKTGTREWAEVNVNCVDGCSHGCKYCYARHNALRFKRIAGPEEWTAEKVRVSAVEAKHRLYRGKVVMFPTTHDITPSNLEACLALLETLLTVGNEVLIVSKPHFECIVRLTNELGRFGRQVTFRFTIGSLDDRRLAFWEPNAPDIRERVECLAYADGDGWRTSVSAEPLLDAEPDRAVELVRVLEPHVSDTIWLGPMNRIRGRTAGLLDPTHPEVARLEAGYVIENVRELYRRLADNPKVRWKDSFARMLGVDAQGRPRDSTGQGAGK